MKGKILKTIIQRVSPALLGCLLPCCVLHPVSAAENGDGWSQEAKSELAYVAVFGNTESQTGSVKAEYRAMSDKNELLVRAGGSYGMTNDVETVNTYYGRGKFSYYFLPGTYFFGLLGFESNRFSGYWARSSAQFGVGHLFFNRERHRLSGETGIDYSYEVLTDSDGDNWLFSGITSVSYQYELGEGARLVEELSWIYLWEYFYDYRLVSDSALSVQISNHFGLKTGVTVNYKNVPLRQRVGADLVELERTDTVVYTSLVMQI